MPRESQGWHPETIKSELRQRFGAITHLAKEWGRSRGAISAVLNRPDYSIRLEEQIAEALGVSPHVIWPDRWHPDGTPKKRVLGIVPAGNSPGRQNPSHASTNPHRQKREAA
jgi:Ner family transcriptional regulator